MDPNETAIASDFSRPVVRKGATIQERFDAFDKANPWVYTNLVRLARNMADAQRANGRRPRIGISLLVERLRWDYEIVTTKERGFKLNNDFRSRYARLIESQCPDLQGVFEMRELKS